MTVLWHNAIPAPEYETIFGTPYLVTPDGEQVVCAVENNLPLLVTAHGQPPRFVLPAL